MKKEIRFKDFIVMLSVMFLCFLVGCSAANEEVTENFSLPSELKEYKIICLSSGKGMFIYVLVKKENENREVIGTSQSSGKYQAHTIVVDGEEYIKK
jgi:hypothetical protein